MKTVKAVTYQIISATKYLYSDFAAKMETSKELTAKDVSKSIIIVMSFITVWSFIIGVVLVQEFWEKRNKVLSSLLLAISLSSLLSSLLS
jgi:hypothetical protein